MSRHFAATLASLTSHLTAYLLLGSAGKQEDNEALAYLFV